MDMYLEKVCPVSYTTQAYKYYISQDVYESEMLPISGMSIQISITARNGQLGMDVLCNLQIKRGSIILLKYGCETGVHSLSKMSIQILIIAPKKNGHLEMIPPLVTAKR